MALWRLYYHLIWSTKERRDLIPPNIEPVLYRYMIGKSVALGCIIHAIGGVQNHIHLIASIPPKMAISEYVQLVKGSSTHHINHGPEKFPITFGWQRGYGVFSLGSKQLDDAIAYVQNQKVHHDNGSIRPLLERDDAEDDGPSVWNDGEAINFTARNK